MTARTAERVAGARRSVLVPLAAESAEHVAGLAHAVRTWLRSHPGPGGLEAVAGALGARAVSPRGPFRAAAVVGSEAELLAALDALLGEGVSPAAAGGAWTTNLHDPAALVSRAAPRRKLAFVVGGTGAQWPGMGQALRAHEPVFRQAIDDCAAAFAAHTGWSLHAELDAAEPRARLGEIEIGAMATFAICVALDRVLRSWGIAPDAITGHSMGEIVGAYLAGALDLADAVRVIFAWSQVQRAVATPGQMLVVGLPAAAALAELSDAERDRVSLAAINSPRSTTLAGASDALAALQARFTRSGARCRLLRTGGAFHSHEMEPLRDALLAGVSTISPRVPATAFYTTVTGAVGGGGGGDAIRFDAAHAWRNLRNPVDLRLAVQRLAADGVRVFWELGPHATLASAIAECLEADGVAGTILGTLTRGEEDRASLLGAVGRYYVQGGAVDWHALVGEPLGDVELPAIEPRALVVRGGPGVLDVGALRAAPEATQRQLLSDALIAAAAAMLGVAPSTISPSHTWLEAGLESLHAVRLKAHVQHQLGIDVPLTRWLSGHSIADFARALAEDLAAAPVDSATGIGSTLAPGTRPGPGAGEPGGATTDVRSSPLSRGQRGLWFLQELHADSFAYNLAWPARIDAALQVDALRTALLAVMARHVALRSVIVDDGADVRFDAPVGWHHLLQLTHHDASTWSEAAIHAAVDAAYRVPFDLRTGPTLRFDVFRVRPDRHVVLLCVHHIVADAWSLQILLRDLGAAYEAACAGRAASLPALPWTPADHVAWQQQLLDGPVGAALRQRWLERLAPPLPVLELWTDQPRPARQRWAGASASFTLDPALGDAVKQLARQLGCTVFVVLLSAFYALLARYTRTRDLIVGTPMAGRPREELADMVGYFVNLVPLRAQVEPARSFRALIAAVRQIVLDAMDDQAMPFDAVVEQLQPERDPGRSPVVEVLFEYRQPHHDGELMWLTVSEDSDQRVDLGGLRRVGRFPLRQQEGKFDLQLEMAELPGGIAGVWKYRTDLLDADFIAGLTRHLGVLLRGAVADPDAMVDALPILDADERRAVIALGEARASGGATRALHRWFEAVAAAHPGAVAVIDGLDQLSYAELNQRANQLARALVTHGVVPGQRVGLCVERSAAIVIGELAILKAGAAYVPLDPALPTDRLAFYASDAALEVVVTQRALVGRLAGTQARAICLDEPLAHAGDDLAVERGADDPAYVIYTSGSTGRPKGVVVSHHNVARLFTETERWFGFGRDDVWTLFHSYAFDFSVWEIWGALLYGGRVVVVSTAASQSPELLHQLLSSEGVTVLSQTPSAFQELSGVDARIRGGRLALRWIIFGGEALAPAMLQRWVERHGDQAPRLINMYGITETCVHVTYRPITAADVTGRTTSPIGAPIGDLDVHVLDEHLAPVPAGVPGELYVGGAGVALGYLHRAELTAARFIADPFRAGPGRRLYRTGDLARYSVARGELEYLGRIDSQVKIRGFRIELGEIEHALRAQPEVRDAIVLAEADYLIAYVVPRHDAIVRTDDALASALRDAVATALPAYMVPTAVVRIDRVPRNHNGKIDRAALPAWTGARGAVQDHEPPQGAIEQRIAAIWTELLPVERVGRTDRFFHIGGHSLLATRMILRVREALAVELPILSIFETPMLADFALQVAAAGASVDAVDATSPPGEAAIPRVDRAAPAPLGLAQQRLWFLDRLDPGNPVYNVPMLFRLVGAVDATALERSIERIAERHEVLRTSFPVVGDQPVQHIAAAVPYQLPISDLRSLPAAEREARAREIARDELHQPFDLATGPAWRGRLVIVDETTHWLVLCAHHIVLDGWSVNLYLAELAQHYRAAVEQRASALPPLATQYVDFCAWQRPWLDERLAAQLPFWRAQLAEAPVVLELPADRPRPPVQRFRGALLPFALSAAQAGQVRAFALEAGATPFMVLLAAFQALLHRYTGQADLLVGSPVAHRPRREVEAALGCFVNNLVLRARLHAGQTFRALVAATRATTLDAYAHQDVPFELLVDDLKPPRDLSRNPLFQVMFALQNAPRAATALPGLTIEAQLPDSAIAKFDLSVNLVDDDAGFTGYVEYSTDLFERATIEGLRDALSSLLDHALRDPDTEILDLALLSPDARHQLLVAWNPPAEAEEAPQTIAAMFAAQVAARGDQCCLTTASESLSYRELDARVARLAARLIACGVGPEVPVGICMARTAALPVAMLAVLRAGGACVPMDPKYPRERLAFMAADAAVPVIVTDASARGVIAGSAARLIDVDVLAGDGEADVGGDSAAPRGAAVDDLAYVIYTSGSTGRPKGVALTHRGVSALVRWSHEVYRDDDLQGVLASTSICFDLSIFELFVTWGRGGRVVLVDDLLALQASPLAGGVRLINTVPSAMLELLRMNAVPPARRLV